MGIQFHVIPVSDPYVENVCEMNPAIAEALENIPAAERERARAVKFADFVKAAPAMAARIPKLAYKVNQKHAQVSFERTRPGRALTTDDLLLVNGSDRGGHWIQGTGEQLLRALGEALAALAGPQVVVNDSDDPELAWVCRAPAAAAAAKPRAKPKAKPKPKAKTQPKAKTKPKAKTRRR